jgi:hypothetical protein
MRDGVREVDACIPFDVREQAADIRKMGEVMVGAARLG